MRRLLFIFALFTLGACDCGTKTTSREAHIEVGPDLQFGTVTVGQTSTKSTQIKNTGTETVTIERLDTAPPYSVALTTPLEVNPGDTLDIPVTYAPTTPNASADENHTGQLIAVNDTEDNARPVVNLVGHAVQPALVVTPESLDFGDVSVGEFKDVSITLENRGTEKFEITGVSFEPAGVFKVEQGNIAGTYQPGAKEQAVIEFSPAVPGNVTGLVVLATNIATQAQVKVPLTGKGLKPNVTLCYALAGKPETCLDSDHKSGQLDFGALDEGGTPGTATITLKNSGNVQVSLSGVLPGGKTTRDFTAQLHPCGATATPDFVFTPTEFATKLPADPTASDPNPSQTQTMQVVYTPHHSCPDDVPDQGQLMVKAGASMTAPIFTLNIIGSSKIGLVKTDNFFAQVTTPIDVEYRVFNVGPGPLHVTSVEIVQGDLTNNASTNCTLNCASRASCSGLATPECQAFSFTEAPRTNYDIGAGSATKPTGERTTVHTGGDIHFQPPTLSGTQVVACTRITTNDPFNPVVCGDLKGKAQ